MANHQLTGVASLKEETRAPLPMANVPKYGSCNNDDATDKRQQTNWLHGAAKRIPCLGILFALCASLFLGSAGMLVKMTHSVHGIQVAVFRAIIQLLVYSAAIGWRRLAWVPCGGELWPVFLRASLGASSITCSYFALKLIPLGDATVIRFSLPIWTLIVGYLVLNESCSVLKVSAVAVSIAGVLLIAKPDACLHLARQLLLSSSLAELTSPPVAGAHQLEGSLLALGSSINLALSLIALRLCKQTPAEVTILWLSALSVIIGTCALLALREWRLPNNWLDCLYILLNGICGSIGQWFITSALKIEQTGVISLARTFDIEVAFLYSAFLLRERITVTSIVGSLLVSSGVLAVLVPKWLESRSEPAADAAAAAAPTLAIGNKQDHKQSPQSQLA